MEGRDHPYLPHCFVAFWCEESSRVVSVFRQRVNEFRKAKNEWEQDINDVMNQEPLEDHDFKQEEENSEDSGVSESESAEQEKQTT